MIVSRRDRNKWRCTTIEVEEEEKEEEKWRRNVKRESS